MKGLPQCRQSLFPSDWLEYGIKRQNPLKILLDACLAKIYNDNKFTSEFESCPDWTGSQNFWSIVFLSSF